MQSSIFLLALLAGVGMAVPEPARTFTISTARAGATMGALYFVMDAGMPVAIPPPPPTGRHARPPAPVPRTPRRP